MAARKETLIRWPLDDFQNRFPTSVFQQKWESGDFRVKGVPGAKFRISFYPKGVNEKYKDGCAMYLHVFDFGDHPSICLNFEFWIENGRMKQLKKGGEEHTFVPSEIGWGWSQLVTQKEPTKFARNRPLAVVCKIRPMNVIAQTEKTAQSDVLQKIAADFDQALFADIEVRVQQKVFKVSKTIICLGSPVFCNMFTHDTQERETGIVEIKKEDPDMVELLLRYLYSGKVEGLKDVAARLLPVADCYEVLHLATMCLESLYIHVSIETVLRDLKLAYAHDHAGYFKEKFLKFAQTNFALVKVQSDWTADFIRENSEVVKDVVSPLTP